MLFNIYFYSYFSFLCHCATLIIYIKATAISIIGYYHFKVEAFLQQGDPVALGTFLCSWAVLSDDGWALLYCCVGPTKPQRHWQRWCWQETLQKPWQLNTVLREKDAHLCHYFQEIDFNLEKNAFLIPNAYYTNAPYNFTHDTHTQLKFLYNIHK